jgi:tetratricopeptide (TPR) repeat protein
VAASFFEPGVLAAIALIFLVLLYALKLSKSRVVFFGVAWFFITLLPVSNIVPMPNLMAERYLYLPSVGFTIILASLFDVDRYKKPLIRYEKLRRVVIPWAVFLLLSYSAITIDRNTDWRDDFSLWSKTVKTSPNSYVAHYNLAIEYVNKGKSEEAVHHYKEAIRINPYIVEPRHNLGNIYFRMGRYKEAILEYEGVIQLNPALRWELELILMEAHMNLGDNYLNQGLYPEAVREYQIILNTNPRLAEAHNRLAMAYANMRQFDLARKELEKAIEIDPLNEIYKVNLEILGEMETS